MCSRILDSLVNSYFFVQKVFSFCRKTGRERHVGGAKIHPTLQSLGHVSVCGKLVREHILVNPRLWH